MGIGELGNAGVMVAAFLSSGVGDGPAFLGGNGGGKIPSSSSSSPIVEFGLTCECFAIEDVCMKGEMFIGFDACCLGKIVGLFGIEVLACSAALGDGNGGEVEVDGGEECIGIVSVKDNFWAATLICCRIGVTGT